MVVTRQYAAAAKLLQSCLTLCDPIDGSPPGSPFPGILQARTLERVAISFSKACAILVLDQGSNPCPLHWELEAQNLNHCTSMEIPPFSSYNVFYIDLIWSVSLLVPYLGVDYLVVYIPYEWWEPWRQEIMPFKSSSLQKKANLFIVIWNSRIQNFRNV